MSNHISFVCVWINPLPHGVLATFFLTAGGPIDPPKKNDICREKTVLMTSLRTHRSSAVRREGLYYSYPPPPTQHPEEVLVYNIVKCEIFFICVELTLPMYNHLLGNKDYHRQVTVEMNM